MTREYSRFIINKDNVVKPEQEEINPIVENEKVKKLEENIENAKKQKQEFSGILDQTVEYTREYHASGDAKIISDDAQKFTELWKKFMVNPLLDEKQFEEGLKELVKENKTIEANVEPEKIRKSEFDKVRKRISDDLKKKAGRYIEVSYARPSDISFPSFPYLFIGHGAHWFDNSLLNKQMTLGELFEKEIEIKTKQLEAIKENLQKFKEKV